MKIRIVKPEGWGKEPKPDGLQIIAQMSGYKNLKIEGGFRLQLDIYEAREQDVAAVALLVNRRKVVRVTIEDYEEKK